MKDGDPRAEGHRRWTLPNWRRIVDFALMVAQLERSFEALKAENQSLKSRIASLEADVADHAGQLRVLTAFLQTAVRDVTDANVEKAVAQGIEKLTRKGLLPPGKAAEE